MIRLSKFPQKINSLEKALKVVGKKHDLLIIDCLNKHKGRAGFNLILKDVKNINPRILSLRLKEFEQNKLVTRNLILWTPVRTEYALTPKAEELIEIIDKLSQWGERH